MKSISVMAGLFLAAASIANAENSNERIYTIGTAELPSVIKIAKEGVTQEYKPAFRSQEFSLSSDNFFQMGDATKCDPYLGQTAEDLKISLNVSERFAYGKYNPITFTSEKINVGPVGKANVTIPKGSNAYGRCQNDSLDLNALSIQLSNPETGDNEFERTFQIEWLAQ